MKLLGAKEFKIDEESYNSWKKGEFIQNAFPNMLADD